ncbi:hypothetical protein [Nocardia carnea]|uniref:hypothetical protein n=1 Tax=Nocardia carnea TaxID=37328 RepID=UPI0024538C7F|nr:hypothetical protein [Nocardia carnea]
MADDHELPLSARVDQLFDTFHSRAEPEQSMHDVADSVSNALGDRVITAEYIAELRAGKYDGTTVAPDLLTALARHFDVPPDYLLLDGHPAVGRLNQQMRLLVAARNAGIRHLEMRGGEVDIEVLIEQFQRIAEQEPPSDDEST